MTVQLFPYQIAGSEFLAERKRALLADDMGLGKSAQTIRACDLIGAKTVLVICPASLRINWQREFQKFQTIRRHASVIRSAKDAHSLMFAHVTIISYELAAGALFKHLMRMHFDVLVIEEAHAVKERTTKRAKAIFGQHIDGKGGLISRAEYAWALTGTPAPSHMGELWTLCRGMFPSVVTHNGRVLDYWSWVRRTCNTWEGNWGLTIQGSKPAMVPEVKAALQPHMIRRLKKDVLPELPPIRYEECPLDADSFKKALADLENGEEGDALREALSRGESATEALESATPHIATLRKLLGTAKVQPVIDLLKTEFDGGLDKIVLFAYHRDVIEGLREGLDSAGIKTVVIYGGVSPTARQDAVDSFQSDPEVKVFIGQLTAASTGLTLTASSNLMYVETDWVPAVMEQSAMRVHRIGQTKPVLVRFASVSGSLDEQIAGAVRRKMEVLTELFG